MFRKPLAISSRSGRIDALHYGSVAVCKPNGDILHYANDPHYPTYLRSSIKMIQALPVMISGAAATWNFTEAELAVCCASHVGSALHVETVAAMLKKIGLSESDLRCGSHYPDDLSEHKSLLCSESAPSQLHNNCSGKHAGMLAVCRQKGWPIEDYLSIEHPLQQWILDLMSEYSGIGREKIGIGVDGCSLPAYYMPLSGAARIIASFMERAAEEGSPDKRILQAVAIRPEMINEFGGFDTELVRVGGGRIMAKRGAMGILLIGVQSPVDGPLGIAIKLEDGIMSTMPVVAMKVLESLNLLTEEELIALQRFHTIHLTNWRGVDIGDITANFQLENEVDPLAQLLNDPS